MAGKPQGEQAITRYFYRYLLEGNQHKTADNNAVL